MANKLYEETYIQNIANAIREKTGKTDAIMVSQMASEIGGITTGGSSGGSDAIIYRSLKTSIVTEGLVSCEPIITFAYTKTT